MRIAVADDGQGSALRAVHDPHGTMPGRGAYLCRGAGASEPLAACLALALRRRAIPRALRSAVTLDPKLVESVSP
jgi:predicted RNA-binding protein YlxR (DUF448 family)